MDCAGGTKSSSSSHQLLHSQSRKPQHSAPSGTVTRETPPSAQQYRSTATSVSRQERFRRRQQEYFPGIGLDYVNNTDEDETNNPIRSPSPLILDPSHPTPPPSSHTTSSSSKNGVVSRLVRGMGVSRKNHHHHHPPYNTGNHCRQQHHASPARSSSHSNSSNPIQQEQQQPSDYRMPPPLTAADFARDAPRAGFLQKLGTNIPEFKRRFFILQPTTQLYYFLSPNDTMPRGAIVLDDARVDIIEQQEDEIFRNQQHQKDNGHPCQIQLTWPPDGNYRIVLEAKNRQVAEEWCQSLRQERISFVKQELEEYQQRYAEAQYEIEELKQQIENYRFVEQDRDGALEDARRWKEQFEELNEAIRILANHVRKLPTSKSEESESADKGDEDEGDTKNANADKSRGEDTSTEENAVANRGSTKEDEKETIAEIGADEVSAPQEDDENKTDPLETKNLKPMLLQKYSEEKKEDGLDGVMDVHHMDEKVDETNVSRRDVSLLDDDAAVEATAAKLFESQNIMEELDAPGQHFASLVNACQQLRENLRLASEEASTAVEDTKTAQATAKTLQARMNKAEQQLCQLWEENCSIRKILKQKKREKRVLVREVKSMLEQQKHQQELAQQQEQQQRTWKDKEKALAANPEDDTTAAMGSDEEKLISELEEHVISSIRLHEEFLLAATGEKKKIMQSKDGPFTSSKVGDAKGVHSSSSTTATTVSTHSGAGRETLQPDSINSNNTTMIAQNKRNSSHMPGAPLVSLFDSNSSESDNEDEDQEDGDNSPKDVDTGMAEADSTTHRITDDKYSGDSVDCRSISSVAASFGGDSTGASGRSRSSTPLRPNPLLQLDQEEENEKRYLDEQALAINDFKLISLAQHGNATSRLVCPLADVVGTKSNAQFSNASESHQKDLQIYHLTFYTRKIGLQFQKVPAPPTKPRGLLTDAMTADLVGAPHGGSNTAAELKRVAEISTFAKPSSGWSVENNANSCLQVATPIDAVLVCGFESFDDSGNNIRPKLGARLVAFDGVSVEIGKWTFDSIRKAIQARGRPLTLSFRNDFLTTEQRALMTKAVGDMEVHHPTAAPSRLTQQQKRDRLRVPGGQSRRQDDTVTCRPPSTVPSVRSAISHETDHFINETAFKTTNTIVDISKPNREHAEDIDDDLTVSTTGYSDHYSHPPPRRRFTASSVGSSSQASYGYSSTRHRNFNPRSFSEAGSSTSALSSAVGPLLTNLMAGLSSEKKDANFTPDYLHRRLSIEDVPQHQDFKSNLL